MPSLESALVEIVRTTPALTAILGTNPTRFYPDAIPQGVVYPASAYQRIAVVRQSRKLSTPIPQAGVRAQLTSALVQITSFAKTASARSSLGETFREALTGIRHRTVADVRINVILPPAERDTYTGETATFSRQQDFTIWFYET